MHSESSSSSGGQDQLLRPFSEPDRPRRLAAETGYLDNEPGVRRGDKLDKSGVSASGRLYALYRAPIPLKRGLRQSKYVEIGKAA